MNKTLKSLNAKLKTLKINNQFDDNCYQDNKFKIVTPANQEGGYNSPPGVPGLLHEESK